jgi:hypothetical protein
MISADEHDDLEEIELDLSQDEALPWLESDEEDEAAGGIDSRQIILFAGVLLLLLAIAIFAIWYFSNRTGNDAPVADGSTITAPEGPYKERPDDPGGKEFAGTGNVAPAVGEGETREGVMADPDEQAAGPSIETRTTSDTPAEQDGVGVQVGAYGSRARAEIGWQNLTRQTSALGGVRYRVQQGEADIGTVYRLQAVAEDLAAAERLCRNLKADGIPCQVKR